MRLLSLRRHQSTSNFLCNRFIDIIHSTRIFDIKILNHFLGWCRPLIKISPMQSKYSNELPHLTGTTESKLDPEKSCSIVIKSSVLIKGYDSNCCLNLGF